MQRLGGLDSAFLYFETLDDAHARRWADARRPFEAKKPYSFDDYRDYIDIAATPSPGLPPQARYRAAQPRPAVVGRGPGLRSRLPPAPHVVPAPGGDRETADVVADVLSRQMDRSRPLWEMWVLEGRADGLIGDRQQGAPLDDRRR